MPSTVRRPPRSRTLKTRSNTMARSRSTGSGVTVTGRRYRGPVAIRRPPADGRVNGRLLAGGTVEPRRALLRWLARPSRRVGPAEAEELVGERRVEDRGLAAVPAVEHLLRPRGWPTARPGRAARPPRAPSAWTWSSSTQRDTRPMRSASSPLSSSHVRRWYLALAMPHSSGQQMAAWSPAATPSRVWPSMIRVVRADDRHVGQEARGQARSHRRAVHGRHDRLRAVDDVEHEVARLAQHRAPARRSR